MRALGITGVARLAALAGFSSALSIGMQTAASADQCAAPSPDRILALQDFAEGFVAFEMEAGPEVGSEISLHYYPDSDWCRPLSVDRYREEGGAPTLEASFVYPIQGRPNLFAILSWPRMHAGIDMRGRQYEVFAYHQTGSELEVNSFVAGNKKLTEGFVGTIDGEDYTFEGTTERGLISLMGSLGTWSWQAGCNPEGNQLDLTACAFAEHGEAEDALDLVRQELASIYDYDETQKAEMLTRFDAAQALWRQQVRHDLDALFPLQPEDDPSFLYGSSYAMQVAYIRAFLVRHRTEYLRIFWLGDTHFAPGQPRPKNNGGNQ